MTAVEIHGLSSIRIGRRTYRLFYHNENRKPGFEEYEVETHGRPSHENQDKFIADSFRDIRASDLPASFSLSAYEPNLSCKAVDGLWIHKSNDEQELTLSIRHYFGDWTLPQNLIHFYQGLAKELLLQSPYPSTIKLENDEYGASATISFTLNDQDDLYSHIAKASAHIDRVLMKELLDSSMVVSRIAQEEKPLKPDEMGFKWWLRYVLVPLGVAVTAGLIAFMAKTYR